MEFNKIYEILDLWIVKIIKLVYNMKVGNYINMFLI